MAERKMSDALAGDEGALPDASVAAKRRAFLDPDVGAFIRHGNATNARTAPAGSAGPASTAPDAQLNTRVPADIYQRARRAVFECRMSDVEPRTIQDLVSQALHAELKRLGF
ncbi:MAG: hypothetical protein KDE27_21245 [Planctomycetes bacterium]|nr:hypothetical protein [Planctomycetota bacterium]